MTSTVTNKPATNERILSAVIACLVVLVLLLGVAGVRLIRDMQAEKEAESEQYVCEFFEREGFPPPDYC